MIEKKNQKKGRESSKLTIGSTVKVNFRIVEVSKERIQAFEGIIIAKKGTGLNEMITVRKISFGGIGVERTFPLHSPVVESIKVLKPGQTKRAKLYYIRDNFGRKAKKQTMKFEDESRKDGEMAITKEETGLVIDVVVTKAVNPLKAAKRSVKGK